MGPTLTGRWGGQALGRAQAGELGRKNPCSSPKPHFVLKKEERSRKKKKRTYFGFKFTITGIFREHSYLFQRLLKSDLFSEPSDELCKTLSFHLVSWICPPVALFFSLHSSAMHPLSYVGRCPVP